MGEGEGEGEGEGVGLWRWIRVDPFYIEAVIM